MLRRSRLSIVQITGAPKLSQALEIVLFFKRCYFGAQILLGFALTVASKEGSRSTVN